MLHKLASIFFHLQIYVLIDYKYNREYIIDGYFPLILGIRGNYYVNIKSYQIDIIQIKRFC